jgi:hypothetical protein
MVQIVVQVIELLISILHFCCFLSQPSGSPPSIVIAWCIHISTQSPMMFYRFITLTILLTLNGFVQGQQGATCSAVNACLEGCCSQYGRYVSDLLPVDRKHSQALRAIETNVIISCGYGLEFCGKGCQGTCNAVAQCGMWSKTDGTGNLTCPLNVCCSPFGFCGTTEDFCGSGCQSNCDSPP